MLTKKLLVSIFAAAVLVIPHAVKATFGTVDAGYSSTYSEASEWTYDGGNDYSHYDSSSNQYYAHSHNQSSSGHHEGKKEGEEIVVLAIIVVVAVLGFLKECKEAADRRRYEEYRQWEKRAAIEAKNKKVEQITNSVEVVEDPQVPRLDNQKPIFYSNGMISSEKAPQDADFSVTAVGHLALQRKVEVYCWSEDISTRTERRGNQSRTVTDYTYTSCWVDSGNFIDSAGFRDERYNMNVAPNFNTECFQSQLFVKNDPQGATEDAYQLPENCLADATAVGYQREKLMDVYEGRAAPVFANDRMGEWSYNPETATLTRRKFQGLDTIGDVRVTYFVPKGFQDGSQVTILGQEKNKRIEALDDLKTCVLCTPEIKPRDMVTMTIK